MDCRLILRVARLPACLSAFLPAFRATDLHTSHRLIPYLPAFRFQCATLSGEAFRLMNAVDEDHNTALHLAAQRGHMELIEKIANEGLSLEAKNMYGKTPADLAESNGNKEATEWYARHELRVWVVNAD